MRRLLLTTALLLPACGEGSTDRTLNYYFSYDPRSLDPALSTDVPTGEVVSLLFDNLTHFDPDAQLKPGLARSWETDAAGRTYTFHLRHDATFHDGRAIKASDVRASMLRALSPGTSGGRSWPLFGRRKQGRGRHPHPR
jgi:ABC-type transport system substrate-binding protein